MLLCIDIGNSNIYGGVFAGNKIKVRFRLSSKLSTSDEIGLFLKGILRENNCDPNLIDKIAICSVVPQLDYSMRSSCVKYFSVDPLFLEYNAQLNLQILYNNPDELGADRIATALAATALYEDTNLIIVDFGTVTTFCAVNSKKQYLGGAMLPGLRVSMESLSKSTAKLPIVEITKARKVLGKSTSEGIQAGIFYGALGACNEIITRIKTEVFKNTEDVMVLATGGFAALFDKHNIYDKHLPDLVLHGLKIYADGYE
jgi:type III pantothenate kinase